MAYITPADLRLYKDIDSTSDDSLLISLISSAEKIIEIETGYSFQVSSDSTWYYDPLESARNHRLILGVPFCAITSVTVGGSAFSTSDYTTVPRNETPYFELKIKSTSNRTWFEFNSDGSSEDSIVIVGKQAYSQTPPADIKQATRRLVAYLYSLRDSQVFDVTAIPDAGVITVPKGIPADVKMILRSYKERF